VVGKILPPPLLRAGIEREMVFESFVESVEGEEQTDVNDL
jgi:hypothetical protein